MCCANCKACVDPVPLDLVNLPDPVATQPLPDPAFRGPDPWKQPGQPVGEEWANEAFDMGTSKPPKVLPRSYLKWLAVDLDGTLAEGIWTPEEPTSDIGDPIWPNVRKVRDLADVGWKIVIHTARPWHDYESIEAWANFHQVPWKSIVCGKLLAAAYIDDRAINANAPDWTPRSGDARTQA